MLTSRFLAVGLIVVFATGPGDSGEKKPVAGASRVQTDEVAKLRKEVEALRAEVKELRSGLAKLQGETNKQKLIGLWDWKSEMILWGYLPRSFPATTEFTKDGKIKSADKIEGSYELEGNLLKINLAKTTVTWEIKHLDGEELILWEVTKEPSNSRAAHFKKK